MNNSIAVQSKDIKIGLNSKVNHRIKLHKVDDGTRSLDKLAQLPTTSPSLSTFFKNSIDNQRFSKRARSKYFTQQVVYPLLYMETPLHKYYSHAFNCCSTITQSGKKLTSRYCNTRLCNVCNHIRTAKLMNTLIKPLQALGELHFTTLTIPNVSKHELNEAVNMMLKNISNILRVIRERRKIDVTGIRKIETTYNHNRDNYHPHFHILHNKDIGELFISEWLKRYPNANIQAQNTKKVHRNNSNYLNELFKYSTKAFFKDELKTIKVYAPALDVMMQALYNKRTIQSFGKLKAIHINEDEKLNELKAEELDIVEGNKVFQWVKNNDNFVWQSVEGEILVLYKPPDIEFKYYL